MIVLRHSELSDAAALAAVHERTWREAYWGALPDAASDSGLYSARHWRDVMAAARRPEGRDHALLVADAQADDDERAADDAPSGLVGFVMAGEADARDGEQPSWDGEVFMLYVLDALQRRGIGGALLSAAGRHLASRGFFSMGLWCVADNGKARAFYEALGAARAGSRMHQMRGTATLVVGYRWDEHALADVIARFS